MWFLTFLLLMWYIALIDSRMLNHPCDLIFALIINGLMMVLVHEGLL